jgi:hypothetical protein
MKQQYKEAIIFSLFVASMIFAFWLINFDEMLKAFIGIGIINAWFFAILILNITGKIQFADEKSAEEQK